MKTKLLAALCALFLPLVCLRADPLYSNLGGTLAASVYVADHSEVSESGLDEASINMGLSSYILFDADDSIMGITFGAYTPQSGTAGVYASFAFETTEVLNFSFTSSYFNDGNAAVGFMGYFTDENNEWYFEPDVPISGTLATGYHFLTFYGSLTAEDMSESNLSGSWSLTLENSALPKLLSRLPEQSSSVPDHGPTMLFPLGLILLTGLIRRP